VKLLVLTPQYPFPPHQGTTIRNYHLLRHLCARHEVYLATFDAHPGDQSCTEDDPLPSLCAGISRVAAPPKRSLLKRALATVASPLPDMAMRLASPAMAEQIDRLSSAHEFEVVQIEGIEMAPFGLKLARRRYGRQPLTVFDDHNAEYVLQKTAYEADRSNPGRWTGALYSWFQWQKLRRYEALCCRTFDRVIAVSDTDARALQALCPGLAVTVLPNGVDTDAFRPVPLPERPSPVLVYTGKMDFRPNVDAMLWFCQRVLPRIAARFPNVRLTIVGQRPHPRLRPLGQDPRVEITGYVPDVRPFIARATVFVVPLRMGGGTRLKVLEAMAMGKAIVSTHLGCEGLAVTSGREVLLADEPLTFAEQVVRLLGDPAWARELGAHARSFAERHFAWDQLTPRLEGVYRTS
jgi:sugar transferase (PEP-CTERM/EpsH1 system associated)